MKAKNKEVLDVLNSLGDIAYRVYFDKREESGGAYYSVPVYFLSEQDEEKLADLGKKYKVVIKKGSRGIRYRVNVFI